MSSAFVELLRKSNLDYLMSRKTLQIGTINDDILLFSLVDTKTQALKLIACLMNKEDSTAIWSTSLDERAFQLNTRLLDITELSETMNFLSECINQSDFTLFKVASAKTECQNSVSQINATFTHSKTKQSITIQLMKNVNNDENTVLLSTILFHVYKRNEQLSATVKAQNLRISELTNKTEHEQTRTSTSNRMNDSNKLFDSDELKPPNIVKAQQRTKMSLINPMAKRRKVETGINYDDFEDSD